MGWKGKSEAEWRAGTVFGGDFPVLHARFVGVLVVLPSPRGDNDFSGWFCPSPGPHQKGLPDKLILGGLYFYIVLGGRGVRAGSYGSLRVFQSDYRITSLESSKLTI